MATTEPAAPLAASTTAPATNNTPATEEDDDSTDEDDHFETLFKPIDISKILRALYACSALQIILAIVTLILSAYNDNKDLAQTNSIASVIVIVASLINIYGCWYKDRGGLQMSYLLFIWSIGNGSRYFYSALLDGNKLGGFCNRLQSANESTEYDKCVAQQDLTTASVLVAAIAFVLAIANAWMVSNLTEKIQDHQNIIQRKRDIRFALAAQAQKMRTIKKWRKAFETVALGNKLRKSFTGTKKKEKTIAAFATGLWGDDVADAARHEQQPASMQQATVVAMPPVTDVPPLMAKDKGPVQQQSAAPSAPSTSTSTAASTAANNSAAGTGIEMQAMKQEETKQPQPSTVVSGGQASDTPDSVKRRKKKPLPPPPDEPI
eukprot:TRINITY_DN3736_c0_g1_i1.p1 TRINITY_DN3736_c0_g1~~TRINITY_DN3736_c0_g1_i1.p1  ORF type:complete len:378 (+),score=106.87 TRINITY_DN3736_c0_g1_i1:354-1487(+)